MHCLVAMRMLCWVALMTACASAPRSGSVRPDEMSAEGHEHEAQREERAAAWHARQYDPYAGRPCVPTASATGRDPCFRTVANPTAEHLREAERHRRHAAEHRAASHILREAEARACKGIADEDRDLSPFFHREDILRVEPLRQVQAGGEPVAVGARVVFRPLPGMTPEFLQRLLDCHLARALALGSELLEAEDDPLGLPAVKAQAMRVWDGLGVELRSDKPEIALRILARANALAP
jgi:hypothetical protein